MASLSRDKNGGKRILFSVDGQRRVIRLGKTPVKVAESFKLRVEALVGAHDAGGVADRETARWLADLPDSTHEKLSRTGLVEPREQTRATLGDLLDRFEQTAIVKPSTSAAYRQTTGSLAAELGRDVPLRRITASDADRWRKAIADSGLASATVAKRVNVARTIFRKAVRWGMIDSSPFADLRAGSQANPDRAAYIDHATIEAVLDACPNDAWRAIVALSRYAGLRCPSELVGLRWGDVNWERGRMTVRSPKTAAHEGHAFRVVPIAPELRPILLTLFEQAEPGVERVQGERGALAAAVPQPPGILRHRLGGAIPGPRRSRLAGALAPDRRAALPADPRCPFRGGRWRRRIRRTRRAKRGAARIRRLPPEHVRRARTSCGCRT